MRTPDEPRFLDKLRRHAWGTRYARTVRYGLLEPEAMRRVLARERARSDRNSHGFSLLLLEAVPEDRRGRALERSVPRLAAHVRTTDVVGWVDERRVTLLLPETSREGAEKLLERLRADLEDVEQPPRCTVLVYPYDEAALDRALAAACAAHEGRGGGGPRGGPRDGPRDGSRDGSAGGEGGPPGGDGGSGGGSPPTTPGPPRAPRVRRGTPVEVERLLSRPLPAWKRTMDVVIASLGLALFLPLLGLIALVIKLDSPGPVIFRQTRAGRGGRPFTFYKFRSMVDGAEARKSELLAYNEQTGPVFKMTNDPRITRVGRVLRKTSLDELPQLWNVLKGDMTLVGPRPPTLDEVPHYDRWQRRRLEVDGGITGLWQVNGRSTVRWPDYARLDVRYVEHRSFLLDLAILARTIPAVLSGRGAR